MRRIAVFDLGGTHTRAALANRNGLEAVTVLETPRNDPASGLREALERLGGFEGIVGGVAASLEDDSGRVVASPNLPALNGTGLKEQLQLHFGVPCLIRNDTSLVGLGEVVESAIRDRGAVAYVTVSTGVNAALVRDGRLLHGRGAPEVGRMILGEGPEGYVTLESLLGGAALSRRYGCPPADISDPAIWEGEARILSVGLRNLVYHWMPEAIILGGSMTRDIPLELVRSELRCLREELGWIPELVPAKLGSVGGLRGARHLALQENLLS